MAIAVNTCGGRVNGYVCNISEQTMTAATAHERRSSRSNRHVPTGRWTIRAATSNPTGKTSETRA